MKIKLLLLSLITFFSLTVSANITVNNLRVENMKKPLGIDSESPRFSWKTEATTEKNVVQTAYQIMVSTNLQDLEDGESNVWNSGKVSSDQQLWIPFAGDELKSDGKYYWEVKVWTNKGESDWSNISSWTMGLLNENDWKARWIGLDKAMPWDSETLHSRLSARYLRKEFKSNKNLKRAVVNISGLGLYELYINGKKVGNRVLAPSPTDYRKSIFYNTYDITSLIKLGENAIGVILGNGRFYTMRQHYKPYKITNFGYPKLRFNLKLIYDDGTSETIGSNSTWKLNPDGAIRSGNEYDGEDYDARKEFTGWTKPGYNDSTWMNAQRVSIPEGRLQAEPMYGMRIVDRIKPISITRLGNKYIIDFGQNMSGWMRIHVHGQAGDSVKLRFAERLQKDGELNVANLRDALATDIYIMKGDPKGETWAPQFTYHGFRYAEVSGLKYTPSKDDFTAEVISDKMDHTGKLVTSNNVLNQVLKNAWWGILSDYKGMPVDCPQRNERQPWLGDRTMGCWGESFLFNNDNMYSKWGDDIREAQRYDGCIPDVAPAFWNYYTDDVTWPAALPMLCDMTYTQFGDKRPLTVNYAAMKLWMTHIRKDYMTKNYIITKDKYGDWCVPPENRKLIFSRDPKRLTNGKLIATAYYYKMLGLMTKFAGILGKNNDATQYEELAKHIKQGFNDTFFNKDSLFYGNNSATSNLLPLAFGLVPKQYIDTVQKQVVNVIEVKNMPHMVTGVIGTQWVMRELSRMGRADVAYALATNDRYPSWGYMTTKGATTIWELWDGDTANPRMNSSNHVMLLGDLLPWCYENLAGIKSDSNEPGFKHIIMKPNFDIPDADSINASYITPYGKVVSKWKKTPMHLEWQISIPVNTTAEVYLPDGKIKDIGSGSYHFSVDIPQQKGVLCNQFLYDKASFPECHASTIAQTPNGDLVSAFFGGTREGAHDVCIWVCRKPKGAKSWTKPALAADGVFSATVRKACYNPVLFQMPKGPLYLFYKIGNHVSEWVAYMKVSHDGGKTWGKAIQLQKGFLGPVKNKPVMVGNKIIEPSSTEVGGWKIHFEISKDKFKHTYKVGPIPAGKAVLSLNMVKGKDTIMSPIEAIQPSILKYKDGRLQILCRTKDGKLATSWSQDQGETWSPLTLSNIPNNNSGTDAVSLKDGRQLLVYNDVATPPGAKKGARTPLNVAISDDGVHWKMVMTLEDSPVSQYSYPSVIQGKDGNIHIVYTWRRRRIKYVELDPKDL